MTIKPRYRVIMDFDGETPPQEAIEWVLQEIAPLLPQTTMLDFEFEEAFVGVDELEDYIGYLVTVNKGTMAERQGLLDDVFPMNQAKSIAVLEGTAHIINNWDVIYINEGGDYSGSSISGDYESAIGVGTGEPDDRSAELARAGASDDRGASSGSSESA